MSRRAGCPARPARRLFFRCTRPTLNRSPRSESFAPNPLARGRHDGGTGRIHQVGSRMPVGTSNFAELQPASTPQSITGRPVEHESTVKPADFYARPKFPKDDGFQAELMRRVAAYFRTTGKPERDCWQMYLKTVIIVAWCSVSYWLLVFVVQTWWQALPAALSLSCGLAAIGFAIQHDGGHNAYSRRSWTNRLAAWSLDLMGASSYLWYWKHHIFHHTYSNVAGQDTDIELG